MSGPWWGQDVDPARAVRADDDAAARGDDQLAPLTAREAGAIAAELRSRGAGFTPTWTSRRPDDPGSALIEVYAAQQAMIAARLDDLPTKARVEHLRAAGVALQAPRPLEALLVFEVSAAAPGGVAVGAGFEVMCRDVDGTSVTFETTRDLTAVPASLAVLGRRAGGAIGTFTIPTAEAPVTMYPFDVAPRPGISLYLGLDAQVAPGPRLSIGFVLAGSREAPPPASAGGLFPPPGAEPPRLAWELFDGRSFVGVEVIRDETRSFSQSGAVELSIPAGWTAGTPPGADAGQRLYWLRATLLAGEWPAPPVIAGVALNVVPARSGRTMRAEIVATPTSMDPAKRRVLRLAERPVLEGTLALQIDEGGPAPVPWTAVPAFAQVGPDERAFRFDAATGTLEFGDGRNGRPLPDGFRHVQATYRLAVGAKTVAAGAISTLIGSAPFLTSVTNPVAAGGGAVAETRAAALQRGPREIRARNRAVALADYEVMARRAPGADIRRAHAVAGFHPGLPGQPIPGVVGMFVVGPARADGQPPAPTDATLQAVARHLATCAPRGVEIVAAAPVFHRVRVEAAVELARTGDTTEKLAAMTKALDRWFDPADGGAAGEGWAFGGALRHDALVRFLLRELAGAVTAIPRLILVVDGVRSAPCTDVAIPEHDLLWPGSHELVPIARRSPS